MSESNVFDCITGMRELREVEVPPIDIRDAQERKYREVQRVYEETMPKSFFSDATGQNLEYVYALKDQLNYSKIANTLLMDESKTEVYIGIKSGGVVAMTRSQFADFMKDAERYEMNLYMQKKTYEQIIASATDVDTILSMVIEFD